jgi:hypothetical protein
VGAPWIWMPRAVAPLNPLNPALLATAIHRQMMNRGAEPCTCIKHTICMRHRQFFSRSGKYKRFKMIALHSQIILENQKKTRVFLQRTSTCSPVVDAQQHLPTRVCPCCWKISRGKMNSRRPAKFISPVNTVDWTL